MAGWLTDGKGKKYGVFDVNITRQTNLQVAYEKVSNSRNIYECSRTLHKSLNPDIDKANPLVLLISIKLLWLSRNIQWDKELDTKDSEDSGIISSK